MDVLGKRLCIHYAASPTYGEGKCHRGYGLGVVQRPVRWRLFRGSNCEKGIVVVTLI